MGEARSLPLLSQYCDVFTRLHEGKRECVAYGIDRLALNRFVFESAASTTPADPSTLLKMINYVKVEEGDSEEEKLTFCKDSLLGLVVLQEEINTLQKVAREQGIAGGMLTIVGQASIQSPEDHGVSVIRQISELMEMPEVKQSQEVTPQVTTDDGITSDVMQNAANDSIELKLEQDNHHVLVQAFAVLRENWRVVSVDVVVCALATFFAINLVS